MRRMVARARRIGQALVAVALLVNAAPRASASHCKATAAEASHHHRDHAKHTDGGVQCPQWPPVECRRHVDCGAAADLTLAVARESDCLAPVGVARPSTPPSLRSAISQPPTPPPQAARAVA